MAKTENITLNLDAVDLVKIDMLIEKGVYTDRADFLRTALLREAGKHRQQIDHATIENYYVSIVNITVE